MPTLELLAKRIGESSCRRVTLLLLTWNRLRHRRERRRNRALRRRRVAALCSIHLKPLHTRRQFAQRVQRRAAPHAALDSILLPAGGRILAHPCTRRSSRLRPYVAA